MTIPHQCPECGEHDNIGVNFTVYVTRRGEPRDIIMTFTCLRCDHQWEVTTQDFDIDEDY